MATARFRRPGPFRLFDLVGFGPESVLVVPHMMVANDTNIDWDLTYADSSVAPRVMVERYHRVGEIFSARAYDQGFPLGTPTLTAFEGAEENPGPWSYRYGWQHWGARIGAIGSSDNHAQMPDVNDETRSDGEIYIGNEPGGIAVVLAETHDRDGIYEALRARRTYATSGIRTWFSFTIDGHPIGEAFAASGEGLPTEIELLAGETITRVELWGVPIGPEDAPYQRRFVAEPGTERFNAAFTLENPLDVGEEAATWLYYVRAFFEAPGLEDGEPDDALWSSPIWVSWSR